MTPGRLAPLLLLVAAACGDRGPPVWSPYPTTGGPPSEACLRARKLRERAPALFEAGHLDLTVRVLQRAEDLCRAEAAPTWALRVRGLAAVGRSAEAMQLATRIDRSDRAGDAERAAAAAARTEAEAHGKLVVQRGSRRDAPELFDPDEKRRVEAAALFHKGAAAARAGDHAAAKDLFLRAWETWHPNPRALVEAGLEARLAGAGAEAQALWDRAAYDDAALGIRPEMASGAPTGHLGRPLVWSGDGTRLAVGGDDEVAIFDADLHPTLRLHTKDPVLALAFSADGTRVLAGLDSGQVRIFDTVIGTAERDLSGHRGAVRALAASPDLRTAASAADDGTLRLWDVEAGKEIKSLRTPRGAVLAFDPSGKILAAGGEDGRVTLWDTGTGALSATVMARGGSVRALAFAGSTLVAVTAGDRLRWDVTDPRRPKPVTRPVRKQGKPPAVELSSIALRTGSPAVAALTGETLSIDDLDGAPIAATPAPGHEGVNAVALSPSGGVLAVVYRDRTLALFPAGDKRAPQAIATGEPASGLSVTRDGKTLAVAVGGRALVWRTEGERLSALAPGEVRAVAFSPDGKALAMGLGGARIVVHDLAAQHPDSVFPAAGAVDTLAFSPDGARIAAGTAAPSVQIFPASTGDAPRSFPLAAGPVRAVRFSPDGAAVLAASREGVTLFRPGAQEGLRLVPYGPEPRDAAFTPDSAGMVVANLRGELLFGKLAANAPPPTKTLIVPAQALALALGADGSIATAEGDRAVAVRSPEGKTLQRFRDPDAAVRAVALLPAGVAAALADGSLRLHRAPAVEPVATLRLAPGLAPGQTAGVISGPGGHLEIVGPDAAAARASLRCRLGPALYPFEVCADQFVVEGVLSLVLAGKDPAEADP